MLDLSTELPGGYCLWAARCGQELYAAPWMRIVIAEPVGWKLNECSTAVICLHPFAIRTRKVWLCRPARRFATALGGRA